MRKQVLIKIKATSNNKSYFVSLSSKLIVIDIMSLSIKQTYKKSLLLTSLVLSMNESFGQSPPCETSWVGKIPTGVGNNTINKTYTKGNRVSYLGINYECCFETNSGEPPTHSLDPDGDCLYSGAYWRKYQGNQTCVFPPPPDPPPTTHTIKWR